MSLTNTLGISSYKVAITSGRIEVRSTDGRMGLTSSEQNRASSLDSLPHISVFFVMKCNVVICNVVELLLYNLQTHLMSPSGFFSFCFCLSE